MASSAKVTFIPVIHEPGQPGAAVFVYGLEAVRKSDVLPVALVLDWFIHQTTRQA